MNKKVAIITLGWKKYTTKYLSTWIESVRKQDYSGEMKVFIIENEATPESAKYISQIAPEADLILNKTNDGYAKGMNDGIRQAMALGYDYIVVINIHTEPEPSCLSEMIKVLESDDSIGVVQARQMMPDKSTINSLGDTTHFLGFGYAIGYKEKWESRLSNSDYHFMHYPSGSSMLFRRQALEKVGLMEEEYWMYNEDQEIGWRLWLAGYKCVMAPRAVLINDYQFSRSTKKFYWLDRNRIISILICYKILTLILIFPAFIMMEFGHILFSIKTGWFKEKLRVWGYFLKPRTWVFISRARNRNQSLRRAKDKDIVKLISGRIWYQEIDDWKLRVINPVFELYWTIVKKIIWW